MNEETSAPNEALALAFDWVAVPAAPPAAAVAANARPTTRTISMAVRFIIGSQGSHLVKTRHPFSSFNRRNHRLRSVESVQSVR
jgi:hypothetical protein